MSRSIARTAGLTAWVVAVLVLAGAAAAQQKDDPRMLMKDKKGRQDLAPKLGEDAPNFKLKMLKSEREVELTSFKGKKPVVLAKKLITLK